MNLTPALLGIFTGPALLARELETGTFRYAWTQGIGRLRWTVAKLVLLAAALTVLAWAFSQMFAWFFDPFLSVEGMNVLAATVFGTRGIDFAAWVLLAFTIGAFLGMLICRVVPAMAATLGAYLGIQLLAWLVLRGGLPGSHQHHEREPVHRADHAELPVDTQDVNRRQHRLVALHIPVSRFWPMQFIESGWLLALALALGAATLWLVRHRAA